MMDGYYIVSDLIKNMAYQDLKYAQRAAFYEEFLGLLDKYGLSAGTERPDLSESDLAYDEAYTTRFLMSIETPDLDYHNREYPSEDGC